MTCCAYFKHSTRALCLAMLCVFSSQAYANTWQNFWSTPEQRARQQFENGDYEKLAEDAPSKHWKGAADYKLEKYDNAAEAFAQEREGVLNAAAENDATKNAANNGVTGNYNNDVVNRSLYNEATAQVRNGNYAEAIELYDQLLEAQTEDKSALHDKTAHNRAIAEQLLQLEQQQQQQQSGEGQDQKSSDENQPQDCEQGESGEQQQGEQQQEGEQQSDEQGQQGQEDAQQAEQQQSEDERLAEEAAVRAALEGEQALQQEQEQPQSGSDDIASVETMTEREQANEQWLKQIPDDPAGLLRRKLENSHRSEFPEVNSSANPW